MKQEYPVSGEVLLVQMVCTIMKAMLLQRF